MRWLYFFANVFSAMVRLAISAFLIVISIMKLPDYYQALTGVSIALLLIEVPVFDREYMANLEKRERGKKARGEGNE